MRWGRRRWKCWRSRTWLQVGVLVRVAVSVVKRDRHIASAAAYLRRERGTVARRLSSVSRSWDDSDAVSYGMACPLRLTPRARLALGDGTCCCGGSRSCMLAIVCFVIELGTDSERLAHRIRNIFSAV